MAIRIDQVINQLLLDHLLLILEKLVVDQVCLELLCLLLKDVILDLGRLLNEGGRDCLSRTLTHEGYNAQIVELDLAVEQEHLQAVLDKAILRVLGLVLVVLVTHEQELHVAGALRLELDGRKRVSTVLLVFVELLNHL